MSIVCPPGDAKHPGPMGEQRSAHAQVVRADLVSLSHNGSSAGERRPKGVLGKSKLDGKEQEIQLLLRKHVSKASIARIAEVSPTTLQHFIHVPRARPHIPRATLRASQFHARRKGIVTSYTAVSFPRAARGPSYPRIVFIDQLVLGSGHHLLRDTCARFGPQPKSAWRAIIPAMRYELSRWGPPTPSRPGALGGA